MPSYLPWRDAEHRDLLLSGLRLAIGDARAAILAAAVSGWLSLLGAGAGDGRDKIV